jgi:hypothetical protein
MTSNIDPDAQDLLPDEEAVEKDILGYLNFSNGKPDPAFQRSIDYLLSRPETAQDWGKLKSRLLKRLNELSQTASAFANSEQAQTVIVLACEDCLAAYRTHHADLLFHLDDADFRHSYFLVRIFEAVLAQGPPWTDRDRILAGMLDQLNDFLGYRPLAVLENGRQMEPYSHERIRPIPIYIRDAGVAAGPYYDLVARTIAFFGETPPEILAQSHFDFSLMDELAVDVRAHDHTHPVNKRTNYMFGEWDPHLIDNQGRYRRFVVRKIILDSLVRWMDEQSDVPREELLYDASAVLCGTMLMASSISGAGPDTHDSTVTLTSLLPKVARQRDTFYARLLQIATGARARRLNREAQLTQQPFGHVRQYLNMHLAHYGARQVQHRHLSQMFARMGYADAARQQAAIIPSASARFESEIQWRIASAHMHLDQTPQDRSKLDEATRLLPEVVELLHRGIDCGAIVDPWNILGLQGHFPLFSSREDSVPDQRVETLLEMMEWTFNLFSRTMGEASAQGNRELAESLSGQFQDLADWWDKFATSTIEDLPKVLGRESWQSAVNVSQALSEWRGAGEAAGDISFWHQHVDRFRSAKAYALVVDALLGKRDHVASMGLLMHWLSQADEVGLESGPHSIFHLLLQWMQIAMGGGDDSDAGANWPTIRRLFDYLEANAGRYWSVPTLVEALGDAALEDGESSFGPAGELDAEEDEEDTIFGAAYDNVTFRDSAQDGQEGSTMDAGGYFIGNTEFELINRSLEPRLKFINMLAQLWQIAASSRIQSSAEQAQGELDPVVDGMAETIHSWQQRVGQLRVELTRLIGAVWDYKISEPSGDHDSNVEYDLQLQTKFYLLHTLIATHVSCRTAQRSLLCCLPAESADEDKAAEATRASGPPVGFPDEDEPHVLAMYRGVMRRDTPEVSRLLPKLLKELQRRPLLYVPLDNGGHPSQILAARRVQTVIRFLLSELPRLGLLRETWHVLKTAYRMERASRPGENAVTEFDRLFRAALRNSLECLVQSAAHWDAGSFSDEDLIDIVGEVVERYLDQWLKHSHTMRLSTVEGLQQEDVWEDIQEFISRYGAELFASKMLTLGNIRAILHNGVERFLQYLAEYEAPLQPIRLLDDLDSGEVDAELAVENLELIYGSVVDKFDRFLEYNTTTTQSDYGEMLYCLLDFLRVESAYERDAWNLIPVDIAHEVLSRLGKAEAAVIWEKVFEIKSEELADQHIEELQRLEKTYGMRLPSISDHLNERFTKPLAVNRMLALIPQAVEDARQGRSRSESFEVLTQEIETYLETTSGSGIDVPPWLRTLEKEVDRVSRLVHEIQYQQEPEIKMPPVALGLKEIRRQLKIWNHPLGKKKR